MTAASERADDDRANKHKRSEKDDQINWSSQIHHSRLLS
jgi:hypothetical protein